MSLLLDALKKAADDKQKASRDILPEPEGSESTESAAVSDTDEFIDSSPSLSLEDADISPEAESADEGQDIPELTEELTLDALEPDAVVPAEDIAGVEEAGIDVTAELDAQSLELQREDSPVKPEPKNYTVSDEALSMLIYKTNRDVKTSKRIVVFSMLLLSLIILAAGGVYYYMDMQAEIATLERKHQIAMQSMRSKTNKDKAPEQSEIIRNLVSDSGLDDKVKYAKKHMADENSPKHVQQRPAAKTTVENNAASSVSFQRTNKADPIADKLDKAWQLYEQGQYGHARRLYEEVLNKEGGNRDALLGLGAIAVIEKNHMMARDTYMLLLKQDPRDPIAIAALASLQDNQSSLQSEEKYLLSVLQKSPDSPQLNFALGNIYAQQEKWKSAQQSYFNAWQNDVENADYVFNLAVSMDQLGKATQAIDFYKDSLSKSENGQVSFSRKAVQKRISELSGL